MTSWPFLIKRLARNWPKLPKPTMPIFSLRFFSTLVRCFASKSNGWAASSARVARRSARPKARGGWRVATRARARRIRAPTTRAGRGRRPPPRESFRCPSGTHSRAVARRPRRHLPASRRTSRAFLRKDLVNRVGVARVEFARTSLPCAQDKVHPRASSRRPFAFLSSRSEGRGARQVVNPTLDEFGRRGTHSSAREG